MANFLTRLVERTWGVAPTVKPAIAPLFAPNSAPILESESLSLVVNEKPRLDQDNNIQTQPNSTSNNIETQSNSATTQPKPSTNREILVSQVPSTPITPHPSSDHFFSSSPITPSPITSSPTNSQTNNPTANNTPAVRDELARNNTDNFNDNFKLEKLPQGQETQNNQSQKTQTVNSIPNQEIQDLPLSTNTEEHLLPVQPSFNLSTTETKTLTNNKSVSSHHPTTPSSLTPHPSPHHPITTSPAQATSSQTEIPTQQTIKVQIGRIEIRAQTPTKPSQSTTRQPQGPRISLDEYLRSHLGGKR